MEGALLALVPMLLRPFSPRSDSWLVRATVELNSNGDQKEREMRSDHCRDSRECTRHYITVKRPCLPAP